MSDAIALTYREYAILRGLASGLTQTQLAARFDRSIETVQRDMRSLSAKLGATTRPNIIDRAWRLGLLGAQNPPMPHEKPLPLARFLDPPQVIAERQRDLNEALNGNLRRAA